ncbi:TIR domain-containing protein [Cupriavidus sp.]|uniref:toll/interleukin-1 receptor domain-containing protein n=1 Tax=Cupriavidus sp. TaxID=1873897 RepID=UPI003D110F81
MEQIRVFISYSWDNDQHRAWVRKFVDELERIEELTTVWDGYDLDSLIDKNFFMEKGIHEADYVVVISTAPYKAKADDRKNGVGLETILATALHWEGLLRDNRSKVIGVLREPNSMPRYLAGHFYIDFTQDAQFSTKFEELLRLLQKKATFERPKKTRRLAGAPEASYDFTRVEELIQVNHPNRRAVVNTDQGTDFSGSLRVKYELWETKSPALGYFLALHPSGTISHIVPKAAEALRAAQLRPNDITVLRPRPPQSGQELVASLFAKAKMDIQVHELTYKDYIWSYCIDASLKGIDPPSPIENYTNQALTYLDPDSGELVRVDSAVDYIVETLGNPSRAAAHLVVAPGGMGKTSLCLSVAKMLHFRDDLRSSVILIQAESIKKYVEERGLAHSRIETVYDIYEIYAKLQGHGKLFERSTFDLAVVCGNLTVIIDGLDEIASLFQDRFDVLGFLESLKHLHDQLGSSNVLLTTRNNAIAEEAGLDAVGIERYELLGFDIDSCRKYVGKRLTSYPNSSELITKVMTQITKLQIRDDEGRIIPFLADICTTVIEDGLRGAGNYDLDVSDDPTPYPSNNSLTDHIVHSMLRRETTRQSLEMSEIEVVELISELVVDYGKRWPIDQMLERLKMLYDDRAQAISSKLELNPLLVKKGDDIELRYSFLSSYFEVLLMLRALMAASIEASPIRAFARLSPDNEEGQELKRYFLSNCAEVEATLTAFVPKLRDLAGAETSPKADREGAKRAMAGLLSIFFSVHKLPIGQTTEKLLAMFGLKGTSASTRTLSGLHIKGAFPPLDFSNLIVTQSRFLGYRNLMAGRFRNTKFMYSTFEDCANLDYTNTELEPSMIDSATCTYGDLQEAFVVTRETQDGEKAMIKTEVEKFLGSFFSGDRFTEKRVDFIKYSNKLPGLAADRFARLVAEGYFFLAKSKKSGDFYEVVNTFRPSVRKYLSDNYPDAKIKRFIEAIK